MLFFHSMWDSESQRIGKQKCTPVGYSLHVIGELIGFCGLLMLLISLVILGYKAITGAFDAALLRLVATAFGLGIVSEALVQFSWLLARRKGFRYDYERCEASWVEAGQQRTYKYQA